MRTIPETIIPYGEWLPDNASLGNKGALIAKNVIPSATGYKSLKSQSVYSNALTAYCRGAISMQDKDGNYYNFSGDETKLYELSSSTWSDKSKVGGYTTGSRGYWELVKWGNKCIATNFDNPIQVITLGSANFADLAASAPKARHIAAVREFVVAGNTYDTVDGNIPNRVRWSAIKNETDWTVAAATQADYQDLQGDGGWVQRIIGGERGIVFQERAIWYMSYVGSPTVFQFDKVEEGRGLFAPRSAVPVGENVFYLSHDGFYVFSGGSSISIGANKIDRTFINELDGSNIHRVVGAYDVINKVLMWIYPATGNTGGLPNKAVIYDSINKKWSFTELESEYIYQYLSTWYTLEQLDAINASLDALVESLDSPVYMGGSLSFASFNSAHNLSFFSGTAMDATIDTGEFGHQEDGMESGRRSRILEVRPLVDGGTHSVSIGTRNTQAGTVSWSSTSSENSRGICNVRVGGRYHRIRSTITGNFNDAVGLGVGIVADGYR